MRIGGVKSLAPSGLPEALARLQSRSLLAAIAGTHLPRPILAELLPSTALPDHQVVIIDRGRKLGHKAPERRLEMFDPTADPRQMRADGTAR